MKIATLKHTYMPDLQGKRQPRIHGEDYETLDDAIAKITEWNNDIYVTDNNESGRPTYVVVEDVPADYVSGGRNEDMSNYDWDNAACDCGECGVCCEMMIDQDRQYLLNWALYK